MECYNPEFFTGIDTVDLCITMGVLALKLEQEDCPINRANLELYEAELDRRLAQ